MHVSGGAQLELTLPLAIDLGPISLSEAYLDIGISGGDLVVGLAVAFGATLGPIDVSVDHIGLQGLISFPAQGGNLGPANLAVGFKPPTGLGIAIDAGVVSGGGFISFDPAKGRYAGVLDVTIADIVAVKVIGVLDTKLPDGSSGYLVSPDHHLRSAADPARLRLYPEWRRRAGRRQPHHGARCAARRIARAHAGQRSVSTGPDRQRSADHQRHRKLLPAATGPLPVRADVSRSAGATPTLLDPVEVGVILEVPDPVRLAILGEIKVAIPTPDLALIEMNIDVLGTIDFGLEQDRHRRHDVRHPRARLPARRRHGVSTDLARRA